MGRPRAGKNLKRTITLSLSEEAIAKLDAFGPNRSAAADHLITHSDPSDYTLVETYQIPVSKPPPNPDRKQIPNRKTVTPIFKH